MLSVEKKLRVLRGMIFRNVAVEKSSLMVASPIFAVEPMILPTLSKHPSPWATKIIKMPALFKSVMVTGHRPTGLTEKEQLWSQMELRKTLKRLQLFHGIEEVISGMALGADTWWAQAALAFDLPLAAYIPFEVQPTAWPQKDREIWKEIRGKASREVVLGQEYDVRLFHGRNDAMIRDADLCVALWKESTTRGGTYSAVQKIRKLGKPLILLNPETETVSSERFEESADNKTNHNNEGER